MNQFREFASTPKLYIINTLYLFAHVYCIIRVKSNADIEVAQQFLTDEKPEHILSDEDIRMTGFYTSKKYAGTLRIVRVFNAENDQTLILVTNQMSWPADTIAQLYQASRDIEVFFKHLKQFFRVKTFVGTLPNAVRIQMWCSMIAMLFISYWKKRTEYKWDLSNLITFLCINLLVKINLWHWVNNPVIKKANAPTHYVILIIRGMHRQREHSGALKDRLLGAMFVQ